MRNLPIADFIEAFPIPILCYRWADSAALNQALTDLILAEEGPVVFQPDRSGVGSWQSPKTLHEKPDQCVHELTDRALTMLRSMVRRTVASPTATQLEDWSYHMWANVNRDGHYNRLHSHSTRPNPGWLWRNFPGPMRWARIARSRLPRMS